jgi:hypothetical protein
VDSARRQPTTAEDEEAGSDEEEDESTPRSWWRFRSRQITDADPEALEAASKYAVGHLNCAALFADDAVGVPEVGSRGILRLAAHSPPFKQYPFLTSVPDATGHRYVRGSHATGHTTFDKGPAAAFSGKQAYRAVTPLI